MGEDRRCSRSEQAYGQDDSSGDAERLGELIGFDALLWGAMVLWAAFPGLHPGLFSSTPSGSGRQSAKGRKYAESQICGRSKYPPAEPVALRLLAPQRGLTATVEKQKQEQKQRPAHFTACNGIDRSRAKDRLP